MSASSSTTAAGTAGRTDGAVVSSVATTINVLEGLLAHEQATGGSLESIEARRRGEEYLLERRLFRRKSTGEVVDPAWLEFSFPTRWHYDVLRALDYFRSAGDPPDPRLAEAIELLRLEAGSRTAPGCWKTRIPGQVHFELEDGDGRPSRWNTLRALRVLKWCGGRSAGTGPPAGLIQRRSYAAPLHLVAVAILRIVRAREWNSSLRLCRS